ncbi:MAG: carbon starvation protein A [Verrucomicrobiales bacterium]|nr:carbon starvation protein A [Verrucomicrobiales bacterium]
MLKAAAWILVGLAGLFSFATLAVRRGEPVNSAHLVVAALCTYAIGYRFYSKWLTARVLMVDDRRATPCEVREDGRDFVRTNRWIVFGHHFAAISGPGPLVGPVLAAQFGYLPGTLWILVGVVLGGAVQDLIILFASIRRDGRSLGQMVREELGTTAGGLALVAILVIMIILLAVLALIVVNALAESPWGVFTVAATVPIAMFMGGYLRWFRAGRTLEASLIGVVLLLGAVWGGQWVHSHSAPAQWLTLGAPTLAGAIIVYGLAASVLPVWLLLAPRDYLSTFMKLGTILALAGGVLLVLPSLHMPALTPFVDGSGPVVPGKVFPFCFITIACGAISGFHSLIASGITPKILTRESYVRPVGYGAMCLESLVAIMALIAACTLEPGVYLAMNIKGVGPDAAAIAADTVAKVNATGYAVNPAQMSLLAAEVGESTLYGRTGGAATLAVGMAGIFARLTQGRWLDLWYHFAIMFEALFILTTLDAGTRVGRYLLQDFLGHLWKPLGDTRSLPANVLASVLIVAGWGSVLWAGVNNPDGGTKALWPIFGIANQLLAAIALCLGTTVLLKMGLRRTPRAPRIALVALLPLLWLLTVTFTAGIQKMFHPSPRIGFLAALRAAESRRPALETALAEARAAGNPAAESKAAAALATQALLRGNNRFDFAITGIFLALAAAMVGVSVREWIRLLRGTRAPDLSETEPVWLPAHAVRERGTGAALGAAALTMALLREWSGEAAVDRVQSRACACPRPDAGPAVLVDLPAVRSAVEAGRRRQAYVTAATERFEGVTRCC